jgi:hypothetical protein
LLIACRESAAVFAIPVFVACSIAQISAPDGGALHCAADALVLLSGCTFLGNAATQGGAIQGVGNSVLGLDVSSFLGNTAIDGGAVNLTDGAGSPAIDAGDNIAVPAQFILDRDANPRFVDIETIPDTGVPDGRSPVDLGTCELQELPCSADLSGDGGVDVSDLLLLLAARGPCP